MASDSSNRVLISVRGIEDSLCLDFANLVSGLPEDESLRFEKLVAWFESNKLGAGPSDVQQREVQKFLARAQRIRDAVYGAFSKVAAGQTAGAPDLAVIEKEAAAAFRMLRLQVSGSGYDWALNYPQNLLEDRFAPVCLSAAQVLTGPDLDRVRECANDTCGWLFLDNSKNRSRKWCDMSDCGNKMKARRHYQRVRASRSG